jgi:hypothetical protein
VTQSPSVQAEQRLAQQYGNPEAAARIRAMSPAEQMALAQKMQRQMSAGTVPAGPMSRNDIRVMELIQKHSEAEARATGEIAAFNTNDWLPMSRKWESDASALKTGPVHFTVDKMSRDEMSKELQARLALDKKRVHLADANLGKAKSLLTKINVIVGPELDAADTAHEAWTQMRNAQLKQKMAGQERAAMMAAIGNVQTIAGLVRDASERAAKAMAAYKTDENMLRGGNTDLCQSM